jgi:hypothetical protein
MNKNPCVHFNKKRKLTTASFLMRIFAEIVHLCQPIVQNINDSLRGKTNFLAQFLLLSIIFSSNVRENEQFHFDPTWTPEARHCPHTCAIQDILVMFFNKQ